MTLKNLIGIHQKIVDDVPALKKGVVYCHVCMREQKVNPAHCLAHGWPKCCQTTMSLDPPKRSGNDKAVDDAWERN